MLPGAAGCVGACLSVPEYQSTVYIRVTFPKNNDIEFRCIMATAPYSIAIRPGLDSGRQVGTNA